MDRKRKTGKGMLRILPMILAIMVMASTASATYVEGFVFCEGNGVPLEGVTVSGWIDGNPMNCGTGLFDCVELTGNDGLFRIHFTWRFNRFDPLPSFTLILTIDNVIHEVDFTPDDYEISLDGKHVSLKAPVYLDAEGCAPPPCGECKGKVIQLTLLYTGPDATVKVAQKVGKRDPGDGVVFEGDLETGDLFSFVGTDKNGTLGTEISLLIDGALNTKIHTSCSRPIYPGMISGLFEVVEGYSLEGGLICPLGTEPDPDPDPGCECDGGVTQLTLQYTGSSSEPIKVTGKGKRNKKTGEVIIPIIFFEDGVNDVVSAEGVFTIIGQEGRDNKLGKEIYIYVGDDLNTTIHTSCSQPIGIGLVSGDFVVLEGSSVKGGDLCPL